VKNEALLLEGVMGSGCLDPSFLDFGTGQLHSSAVIQQGKSHAYTLDRKMDGPLNRSRYRDKEIVTPTGTRTPISRLSSL
jgi:hypothetical protein